MPLWEENGGVGVANMTNHPGVGYKNLETRHHNSNVRLKNDAQKARFNRTLQTENGGLIGRLSRFPSHILL